MRRQYFAEMNLAAQRINRSGSIDQLAAVTSRWREDASRELRDWEWHYLKAVSLHRSVVFKEPSWDAVIDASWSPDDQRVILIHEDETVPQQPDIYAPRICDTQSGQVLLTLEGHTRPTTSVDWHPRLDLVVSASEDKTIRIWDANGGNCLAALGPLPAAVTLVKWDRDGTQLGFSTIANGSSRCFAVGFADWPNVDIRDARKSPRISDFLANRELAWSPDGSQIAVGMLSGEWGQDLKSTVWDIQKNELILGPIPAAGTSWKPQGHQLDLVLRCNPSGEVHLLDHQTNKEVGRLQGHTAQLNSFQFSPDGEYLATAGFDRTVRIWGLQDRHVARIFQEHPSPLRTVRWSNKGNRILTASWEKDTRCWETTEASKTLIQVGNNGSAVGLPEVLDISWHPKEKWIAVAGPHANSLWDTSTGELVSFKSLAEKNWFGRCAWNATGDHLAFAGSGIHIHSVQADGSLEDFRYTRGWTHALDWNRERNEILAAVKKGVSVVRESESRWTVDAPFTTSKTHFPSLRWNPVLENVVAYSNEDRIVVADLAKGEETVLKGHTKLVLDLAWSPDGKRLASCAQDDTAKLWNFQQSRETHTLRGHSNFVNQISWAPNGQRIATAGRDGTVKVWDSESGAEILSLLDLQSSVNCVAWSPSGKQLAAGGLDGNVAIWNAAAGYPENSSKDVSNAR